MTPVPTIRPDGPKETGVPEIVNPGPPEDIVVPPTEKTEGLGGEFPTPGAGIEGVLAVGISIVLAPITRPDDPREIGVFETVMAGAP
jgi:hypothetical protein